MKTQILIVTYLLNYIVGVAQTVNLDWSNQFGGEYQDSVVSTVVKNNKVYCFGQRTVYESESIHDYRGFITVYDTIGNNTVINTYRPLWFSEGVDFETIAGDVLENGQMVSLLQVKRTNWIKSFPVVKIFNSQAETWALYPIGTNFIPSTEPASTCVATDIKTDENNNIYIYGYFNGTINFNGFYPPQPEHTLTRTTPSVFVLKLNSNLEFEWVKAVGTVNQGVTNSSKLDVSGDGIILTGNFYGTVCLDPNLSSGPGLMLNEYVDLFFFVGYGDVFITKWDFNGNFLWQGSIRGYLNESVSSISIDSINSIILTGAFQGNVDFDPTSIGNHFLESTSFSVDGYILKITEFGIFDWIQILGGPSISYPQSNTIDNEGSVYTLGTFNSTLQLGNPPTYLISNGGKDFFMSKHRNNGDLEWVKQIGSTINELNVSVDVDVNNNVYLGGTFTNTLDLDPTLGIENVMSAGNSDGFVVRYTPCQPSFTTVSLTACDSFTWVNGINYYSSNSSDSIVLQNNTGCDSIIYLNLILLNSTITEINETTCDSFVLNGQTYTESGIYTQNLTNSVGCDSTITLSLTILNSTFSDTTFIGCDSYTLNGETYTESGIYTQHLINSAGCDSTITLSLTILKSTFSDTTLTVCESYSVNGETYTESGMYTQHLTNSVGCDSTITLNLTIPIINTSVVQNQLSLTCEESNASYQWIDCSTNQLIFEEISQTFLAVENGSYKVVITVGACVDTSECVDVTEVELTENIVINTVSVFPNPSASQVQIRLSEPLTEQTQLNVITPIGQLVYSQKLSVGETEWIIDFDDLASGIYQLQFLNSKQEWRTSLVLE